MTNKELLKKLEERKVKLSEIANTAEPINPRLWDAHNSKVSRAEHYIYEIDRLLTSLLLTSKEISIVSLNKFTKKVDTADLATIVDEGLFFKVALINNFPEDEYVLIYLAPLSDL